MSVELHDDLILPRGGT